MALVDSEAAFEQRLREVMPALAVRMAVINAGIRTFSGLAFASGTPQNPPSDDVFRTFADGILPAGYDMATYSSLRRLHFEASTLVVAQLKSKVIGDPDEGRHKLPIVEKQARLDNQRRRLVGVEIEGELQPSYQLIDAVNNMIESNTIQWIAPSKATSRDQEVLQGAKNLPSVVQLEQHTLKLAAPDANLEAECGTALQLQWCLQRRALALDQVRLSSWECQNKWISQLLTTMSCQPPPGHGKITLEQIIKADKQLWTEMSKAYTGAVLAAVGQNEPPLDELVLRLRNDPRVTMYLLPLPVMNRTTSGAPSSGSATGPSTSQPKTQPKKKFKATKKAEKSKPDALAGMETVTKDGSNVCWAYNLEAGCQATLVSGAKPPRCAKGLHVCAFCHKPNHSQLVCNLKKKGGASWLGECDMDGGCGSEMFQQQFHEVCDKGDVLESSPKHYEGHFENLAQQSLKDVRKLSSKHKVRSEELSDKVIGKNLGEEPRQVLDEDQKFQGQAVKDLYFLELFAGTARLTKCFGQSGFKAMAFDKTSKRSEGQSVLEYDLSNRDEVESLLSFIKLNADRIALIHLAPPCGTASRARGKRLRFLKALNIKEPRPLRDDFHPDGFPWLQGSDKIRTEAANLVYENTVLIAQTAIQLKVAVTIENPANSLMWKTSPFLQLFESFPELKFVTFHNCAHGGVRDKLTSFATNVSWFDSLALLCDKQHSHAPWTPTVVAGKVHYPTHTEAAYPEVLCQRIVSLVLAKVLALGAVETETLEKHVKAHGKSLNRVVLGAMPRGRHVKPLVSEFGEYINVILSPQCDAQLQQFISMLPKGAKVQTRHISTWGQVRDDLDKQIKKRSLQQKLKTLKQQNQAAGDPCDSFDYETFLAGLGCEANSNFKLMMEFDHDDVACEKVVIAVPREPHDFMVRAVQAGHPRSVAISLPPDLCRVVDWNRDTAAFDIYKHRIEFVKFWSEKAKVMKFEDEKLLEAAPPHLRKLLCGKRLALWQAMIDHYEYPDKTLVQDVLNGFKVTGWLPDAGIFPKEFRPPSMDTSTLESISKGLNQHVKTKVIAAAGGELSEATWIETQKELAEGWMEIDPCDGEGAAWAMRFGLQQKDKIRVIDDFSIAGVNQTTGLHERLKIFGIDDIAAMLAYSLDSCQQSNHPQLVGKTIDLKSAYKQFGICAEDRTRIRVATSEATSKNFILLLVNALPFGATGSVAAFLRISMFIWYVGVIGLHLAWTSFYDDYTSLSRSECAPNASWGAECLFDLLGVVFAREGKKATVFDKVFNSLGVKFDLEHICNFSVLLGHTETRRVELIETISDFLSQGTFSSKGVERLRGRLLWYENFVCGRQANSLVAKLGKFMKAPKGDLPLDTELKLTLQRLLDRLEAGKPVTITRQLFCTWICFTDGACEQECSIGGVLVSPQGTAVSAFGSAVPQDLVQHLYNDSKHPIYEVELLPLLVSLVMWGSLFQQCQVVFYVDNDSARAGLIKGAGATKMADAIIECFCSRESNLQLKAWFSRVASHSNISDGPSRSDFSLVERLGCAIAGVPWQTIGPEVLSRLN